MGHRLLGRALAIAPVSGDLPTRLARGFGRLRVALKSLLTARIGLTARWAATLTLVGAILSLPAMAQEPVGPERILDFASVIWVEKSGDVVVEETITVVSTNQQIRRGIFRDLPTDYRDHNGQHFRVDLEVLGVRRNDAAEPFHTERTRDGLRIYIGRSDVTIEPGRHKYALRYRTRRQVGHFDGFDEVYWNVTGNNWAFPIEHVSARIHLPAGAEVRQHAAYTGDKGDRGSDFTFIDQGTGSVWFETTRPLGDGQGLTVAVGWQAGLVTRPTTSEQLGDYASDHGAALFGGAWMIVLAIYYFLIWWRVGRDPVGGPVVPQFGPPAGVSPAAARYLMRMDFDHKTFVAAVVSMAVKGFLDIAEDHRRRFTLVKTGQQAKLSPGEQAVAAVLFSLGRDRIELTQANRTDIVRAISKLSKILRTEFEQVYFVTNRGSFWIGIAASLLMVPMIAMSARDPFTGGFLTLWLSVWSVGVYFLVSQIVRGWRAVLGGAGPVALVGAIAISLFGTPFVIAEIVVLGILAFSTSIWTVVALVGVLAINITFYHLLKAPTRLGRATMDKIEGFKQFLSVAGQTTLAGERVPDETAEMFEQYLPYALALDVEREWADRMTGAVSQAVAGDGGADRAYRPGWYTGSRFDANNLDDFGRSLSTNLSSAVRSSSSSGGSGSSGGGSSGGGGGGGGGGGW